ERRRWLCPSKLHLSFGSRKRPHPTENGCFLGHARTVGSSREPARPPRLHHLLAREVQSFGHERGESFDQLVTEARIGLALGADRLPVELEHLRILVGPRLEGPL